MVREKRDGTSLGKNHVVLRSSRLVQIATMKIRKWARRLEAGRASGRVAVCVDKQGQMVRRWNWRCLARPGAIENLRQWLDDQTPNQPLTVSARGKQAPRTPADTLPRSTLPYFILQGTAWCLALSAQNLAQRVRDWTEPLRDERDETERLGSLTTSPDAQSMWSDYRVIRGRREWE